METLGRSEVLKFHSLLSFFLQFNRYVKVLKANNALSFYRSKIIWTVQNEGHGISSHYVRACIFILLKKLYWKKAGKYMQILRTTKTIMIL